MWCMCRNTLETLIEPPRDDNDHPTHNVRCFVDRLTTGLYGSLRGMGRICDVNELLMKRKLYPLSGPRDQ